MTDGRAMELAKEVFKIGQLDLQCKMHGKLSSGLVSEGAVTYNELETMNLLANVQLASPAFLKRNISASRPYGPTVWSKI